MARERWRGGEGSGRHGNDRGWQVRLQKVSSVNLLVVLSVVLWPSQPTTCWNDITYNHRLSWRHVQSLHSSKICIMIGGRSGESQMHFGVVTLQILGVLRSQDLHLHPFCCKTEVKMLVDKLAIPFKIFTLNSCWVILPALHIGHFKGPSINKLVLWKYWSDSQESHFSLTYFEEIRKHSFHI